MPKSLHGLSPSFHVADEILGALFWREVFVIVVIWSRTSSLARNINKDDIKALYQLRQDRKEERSSPSVAMLQHQCFSLLAIGSVDVHVADDDGSDCAGYALEFTDWNVMSSEVLLR